ncbi:large subunit ribosomal protein L26e [Nematocida sp. AWRm77]|nr:large subunit ribosomal protein L26e [Nematocida sp. AWRm77]
MKFNNKVSSSRRKCRKAHFRADDAKRRIIMSSNMSKELREQYGFKSFPVVVGDTVLVMSGDQKLKGHPATVVKVCRATYKVELSNTTRTKQNGSVVRFGVHPSNLQITKFCMDHNREALLEKKKAQKIRGLQMQKEKEEREQAEATATA